MVGILKEAAVIRGDIGLTLGAVDEQCVDLVQVLGGQLHRRGEAGAAQTHQAAGPDGVHKGLVIRHLRGGNGGVHLLLAVGHDDHSGLGRAVGGGDGGDLRDRTGDAGVDVRGHKAPGLSDDGAYVHLIALGHSRRRRSADVLAHGQDDLGRKRHRDRLKVGSSLLVRNSRALRRAFEKFTHSDFNLPILQSLGK